MTRHLARSKLLELLEEMRKCHPIGCEEKITIMKCDGGDDEHHDDADTCDDVLIMNIMMNKLT